MLLRELKEAIRSVTRTPGLTIMTVSVLGLGVGLVTTAFSLVDAVFLAPLPYADADHLVRISQTGPSGYREPLALEHLDAIRSIDGLTGVAGYRSRRAIVQESEGGQWVNAADVTPNTFAVLGVHASLGRGFGQHDAAPTVSPVVVISQRLWQSRFGKDPAIVGRAIRVDGQLATVVGVMPERVAFPERTDLWRPFATTASDTAGVAVIARVGANASSEAIRARLEVLSSRLFPAFLKSNDHRRLALEEGALNRTRGMGNLPWLAFGVTLFILLIAASDVAGLQLARATNRRAEMAVRSALGASRCQLFRRLLLESTFLGVLGAALGILLSVWGLALLRSGLGGMPVWIDLALDARVLAFVTIALAAVIGVIGITPSLESLRVDLSVPLRASGASFTRETRVRRLAAQHTTGQFVLAFVLVFAAMLFGRSLTRLAHVDWGIDAEHVVVVHVQPPAQSEHDRRADLEPTVAALAGVPGLKSAVIVGNALRDVDDPDAAASKPGGLWIRGQMSTSSLNVYGVGDEYFNTLNLALMSGRPFAVTDGANSSRVAILSRSVAERIFPGGNAVGREIRLAAQGIPITVVGVAEDQRALYENRDGIVRRAVPFVYVPLRQWIVSNEQILARTAGGARSFVPVVAAAVRVSAPASRVVRTETLADERGRPRLISTWLGGILSVFAVLGLGLALLGVYGVTAFHAAQRTREMGIRRALGATRPDILRVVMGGGFRLALVATGIAVPFALALIPLLRRFLYDAGGVEALPLIGTAIVFLCTVALATWIPARRAASVQPSESLRQ